MVWNPNTYLAFADERTRPAAKLLVRIPDDAPHRVIDLGCGPGNSTELLRNRWPEAEIEGLDSSPDMLAKAASAGVKAKWIEADLGKWSASAPYDVIYSNATLHWLPDHNTLLPRLLNDVKPGGTFAFQVPRNMDAPSHRLMRESADAGPWRTKLKNVREVASLTPHEYCAILAPHAASVDIWETEYLQQLKGEDAVYTWVSGTGLRPFVQALDGADRDGFIGDYKQRLNAAYPARPDGITLFPFKRLFAVVRK